MPSGVPKIMGILDDNSIKNGSTTKLLVSCGHSSIDFPIGVMTFNQKSGYNFIDRNRWGRFELSVKVDKVVSRTMEAISLNWNNIQHLSIRSAQWLVCPQPIFVLRRPTIQLRAYCGTSDMFLTTTNLPSITVQILTQRRQSTYLSMCCTEAYCA